jgi:mitogen-activated protein kinase kinase
VRSCLNKTAKLRPTYSALLQHAWLAPLANPAIIEEEDEEAAAGEPIVDGQSAAAPNVDVHPPPEESVGGGVALPDDVVDPEVARWVLGALARRRQGLMGRAAKPALHAAPLDAVVTPGPRRGARAWRVKVEVREALQDRV